MLFYHTCRFSTLTINFSEVWPRQILELGKQFNLMIRLQNILKASLQDVLKMSWRRFCKTSWRCLEDVFARRLEDVLKTSWRRLEDVWPRRIYWFWPRRLEDVFWRRKAKANIFVLIKTSWRRLQDVFWRWRRKTSSRRLHQDECLLGIIQSISMNQFYPIEALIFIW